MKKQQMVVTSLIAVLAVLVLTFFVLLALIVSNKSGGASTAAKPTAIVSPTATPTPPPLAITPQQGWVMAKTHLSIALSVSFGVSNPYVGYACGVAQAQDKTGPLVVSVTNDGGTSWQALPTTSLKYAACTVQVNPTDAQAVLLTADTCLSICYGGRPRYFFVSHDGAKTWQQIQLPGGEDTTVQITTVLWAGQGLLVAAQHPMPGAEAIVVPKFQVAYSADATTLRWLDQSQFYATLGTQMRLSEIATFGPTLAVQFVTDESCGGRPGCTTVMHSNDGGATWERFTPKGLVPNAPQSFATADGTTLLGIVYVYNSATSQSFLVISTDAGRTWAAFTPALPTSQAHTEPTLVRTPDGTFLVNALEFPTNGASAVRRVYRLDQGTKAWRQLFSDTHVESLAAVSVDLAGHPVALWSVHLSGAPGYPGDIQTGDILYHAAT